MVDVFSQTAMHGGRRTGSARVTAIVRGGSTSVRTAIMSRFQLCLGNHRVFRPGSLLLQPQDRTLSGG